MTHRQQQVSRAEQQHAQTMAGVKADPRVPQTRTLGEYRTRGFHRGGGCGIAGFEILGEERVDNMYRSKQAERRCTESDPSRFEVFPNS